MNRMSTVVVELFGFQRSEILAKRQNTNLFSKLEETNRLLFEFYFDLLKSLCHLCEKEWLYEVKMVSKWSKLIVFSRLRLTILRRF